MSFKPFRPNQELSAAQLNQALASIDATAELALATAEAAGGGGTAPRVYLPEDYGAVGDGTTDDVVALQAAIDAAEAAGGGVVLVSKRHAITGADLIVKATVFLEGVVGPGGYRVNNAWSTVPCALLLNSARSVRVRRNGGVRRLGLLRQGLTVPTTVRQGLDAVAAFAGTALRLGDGTTGASATNGTDTRAEELLIVGFATGVVTDGASRYILDDIKGDCTNGLLVEDCFDIPPISRVNWHPFVTTGYGWTATTFAISGVANNGSGLFRVTCATHPFVTGDVVSVYGTAGAAGLNGRWTVTVINATTLDLQGSTFTAGYTSGGVVDPMVNRRAGYGFRVQNADWVQFVACMEYGHDIGWHLTTDCVSTQILGGPSDGLNAWFDPLSVGLLVDGNSNRNKVVGQNYSSKGTAVRLNSTATDTALDLSQTMLTAGDSGRCIEILDGSATVSQCDIYGPVYMADAADSLVITASDTRAATITGQSTAAANRVVVSATRETSAVAALRGPNIELRAPGTDAVIRPLIGTAGGAAFIGPRDATSAGSRLQMRRSDGTTSLEFTANASEAFLTPQGANNQLTIGKTSAATTAQVLRLFTGYATPTNGQGLSPVQFAGLNSTPATVIYGIVDAVAETVTAGAENGQVRVQTRATGTTIEQGRWTATRGWRWGLGNILHLPVTGDPEGAVTAPPGSLAQSDNGTIYVKVTGSGNTGWSALSAASGSFLPLTGGTLTGTLAIAPASGAAQSQLRAVAGEIGVLDYFLDGQRRWRLENSSAGNFNIRAYDASGTLLGTPFAIDNAAFRATITSAPRSTSAGSRDAVGRDDVNALLAAGTNISFAFDSATGVTTISGSGGGGISDAPNDGVAYVRRNLAWTSGDARYQAADATLTALAGLTYTSGSLVPVLTAADTFTLRPVGAAAATDIIDRAAGDARYAQLGVTNTFTGNAIYSPAAAAAIVRLNPASGQSGRLEYALGGAGIVRWVAEASSVSSNYVIRAFDAAGAPQSPHAVPVVIENVSGNMTLSASPRTVAGGSRDAVARNDVNPLILAGTGISKSFNSTTGEVTINATAGGQASIQVQDEGSNLGTAGTVTTINFTGSGVTASRSVDTVTVNVSGGGGGSPGGSAGQVQWNDAGAFAGASGLTINGTGEPVLARFMDLTALAFTALPAEPASTAARIYSAEFAGIPRVAIRLEGDGYGQIAMPIGPEMSGQQWGFVRPESGTTIRVVGMGSAGANSGTVAHPAPALTDRLSRMVRFTNIAAAAGNAVAGFRSLPCISRGTAAGIGGFRAHMRVATVATNSECGVFFGLTADNSTLGSTDIRTTRTNMIGVGRSATGTVDTNWQLYRRTGTGTAAADDLGVVFSTTGGDIFDIFFEQQAGASWIGVRVVFWPLSGAPSVLINGRYTTDLPADNVLLSMQHNIRCGATSFAPGLACGGYTVWNPMS